MAEVFSQDEIDQLLTAIATGDCDPKEDFKEKQARKTRIYDFARPDRFSKEQIRAMCYIHEVFSRLTTTSLSARVRSLTHVHVASVDQLTYNEFVRSVPTPTCLSIINMDPLKGNAVLEIDPAITFSIIERLLGGAGEGYKCQHELTDIEQSIMEGIVVRLLGNLREAWCNILDLRPRLGAIETNPQFCDIVSPNEMVVLVTLEVRVNDTEGMMNICYPYSTIEPIIEKLTFQHHYKLGYVNPNYIIDEKRFDDILCELRVVQFKQETTLGFLMNKLKAHSTIKFEEDSHAHIMIDNVRIADCNVGLDNIIEIKNKNYRLENSFMEDKHNVKYDTGLGNMKVQLIGEIGRTTRYLKDVLGMGEGSIIELDKVAGSPIDVFANNILIAKGEVIVIDEDYGIRITEVINENIKQVE